MDDPPLADRLARAREAAGSLGRAKATRRSAALARYLDLLAPDERPEGLPDPAAAERWRDPLGEVVHGRSTAAGLLVEARAPAGLVVGRLQQPAEARRLCALAIPSGSGLVLAGGAAERRTGLASARRALSEAGLRADSFVRLESAPSLADLLAVSGAGDVLVAPGRTESTDEEEEAGGPGVPAYGVCHTYVDGDADLEAALATCLEATRQADGPSTATVLVHEALAEALLPRLHESLAARGVRVEAGEAARRRIPRAQPASAATWDRATAEARGVRVVGSLAEALEHVRAHGPGRADAILTRDTEAAARFLRSTATPNAVWNASTRQARPEEHAREGSRRLEDVPDEPEELTRTRCFLLGDHEGDPDARVEGASLAALVRGAGGG